ncbi:MAG: hypothetical protein AAF907_13100 [Planctomycetota bacterium]
MSSLLLTACLLTPTADAPTASTPDLTGVHGVTDLSAAASAEFSAPYRDGRIYFATAANRDAYAKDVKKYEAAANFQLVRTGQYKQGACPLSGEKPDETFGTVDVDGLKVKVLCPECAKDLAGESLAELVDLLFDDAGWKEGDFTPVKPAKVTVE